MKRLMRRQAARRDELGEEPNHALGQTLRHRSPLGPRRIVGWELDEHMAEPLVLAALREAIAARQPGPGLIHHTDRGGQYAGGEYRGVLGRAQMRQSMNRADSC